MSEEESPISRQKLWDDLVRMMVVILLNDMCARTDDPKKTCDVLIQAWRGRIEESVEKQLQGDASYDPDRVKAALQDELNDIEQVIRRGLTRRIGL